MEGKEDQEVTVEVVPQTVTEIIYLTESDIVSSEPNYYIPSEEELEDDENELYEIGSVDPARLQHMSLILDESQTFVLLSQPEVDEARDPHSPKTCSESDEEVCYTKLLRYKCDVCNTKCHSKKNLDCHKLIHASIRTGYTCKECGQHFERAQALSVHFRMCHEAPKLICNICGCPCAHDSALLSHYKKHEPKQFTCSMCESGYDTAIDLSNHVKTHNTDLLYACNKCDAGFASTAEVSIHLRTVHGKPRGAEANEAFQSSLANFKTNIGVVTLTSPRIKRKVEIIQQSDQETGAVDYRQLKRRKRFRSFSSD